MTFLIMNLHFSGLWDDYFHAMKIYLALQSTVSCLLIWFDLKGGFKRHVHVTQELHPTCAVDKAYFTKSGCLLEITAL